MNANPRQTQHERGNISVFAGLVLACARGEAGHCPDCCPGDGRWDRTTSGRVLITIGLYNLSFDLESGAQTLKLMLKLQEHRGV